VEFVFKTDNPGLQQVYDEVQALGVDKPLIPTWFLDGAELKSCEYTQTSATDRVTAYFSHENNVAVITADVYKQSELRGFYRDDTHAEIIELEGIEFYITQNKTKWVAVWSKENTEYFLTVDCQEDALQRILKSIFVLEE